jgi:hypothetical protein
MVMSREWTQRDYQKLWFIGSLKEGKNEAVPEEPGNMGNIQPLMKEIIIIIFFFFFFFGPVRINAPGKRSKNGRIEQSQAMEYGSRKASSDVLKPRNIYIYIYT